MRALPSTFTSITWTEAQYVYAVTYTNYSQTSSHTIEEKDALQTSVPNSSWSHRWYIDCMSNGSYQLLDPRGNSGIALTPHACVCAILCNLALLNEHIKYRCTGVQMPKATACKRYFMRVGRQKGSQHGDVGPIFWGSITQAVCLKPCRNVHHLVPWQQIHTIPVSSYSHFRCCKKSMLLNVLSTTKPVLSCSFLNKKGMRQTHLKTLEHKHFDRNEVVGFCSSDRTHRTPADHHWPPTVLDSSLNRPSGRPMPRWWCVKWGTPNSVRSNATFLQGFTG